MRDNRRNSLANEPPGALAAWLRIARRFPGLSPELQQRASQRIKQWAGLSPAQRKTARTNYRLARERAPKDRVKEWQRYQNMTPEQQSVLREHGQPIIPAKNR